MELSEIVNQAEALDEKNAFAVYNHIEAEFVEPDHAIFRLNIRPESKNPYGWCTAAPSIRWRTTPPATPLTRTGAAM